MNWGWVIAWATIVPLPNIDWTMVFVFWLGCVAWTVEYDTIYSLLDKDDDPKAGVKSTALLFGTYLKPILGLFSAAFVATIVFAGMRNNQGPVFFVLSVGGTTLHLIWQLVTLKPDDQYDVAMKFLSACDMGLILWSGAFVDYLLHVYGLPAAVSGVFY